MSRRGMRGSRRVTVLAAALLGAAVGAGSIAGCSTNDEPEPQAQQEPDEKQEPAPDPEPSEEPTPDEPELPDKLDNEYSRAVLDYYEAYNEARSTGDTSDLRELFTEDCVSCAGMANRIDEVSGSGGEFKGGELTPDFDAETNTSMRSSDNSAVVSIVYRNDSWSVVEKVGAEPEEFPARDADQNVNLIRRGDQWIIKEISSEPLE